MVSEKQATALTDAMEAHKWDDWYCTLLHAGIEETKDIGEAIKLADEAFKKQGSDESTPRKDDFDALFGEKK